MSEKKINTNTEDLKFLLFWAITGVSSTTTGTPEDKTIEKKLNLIVKKFIHLLDEDVKEWVIEWLEINIGN